MANASGNKVGKEKKGEKNVSLDKGYFPRTLIELIERTGVRGKVARGCVYRETRSAGNISSLGGCIYTQGYWRCQVAR